MKIIVITQGEGKYEIYLGRFWGCVKDDRDRPDFCDECEDCEEENETAELPARHSEMPALQEDVPEARYFQMSLLQEAARKSTSEIGE